MKTSTDRETPPKNQSPARPTEIRLSQKELWRKRNRADGTYALVMTGGWLLLACMIAFAMTGPLLGGMTPTGPRTTAGWLAIIFVLMCLPFGIMVFALGVAKSLRNWRRVQRGIPEER